MVCLGPKGGGGCEFCSKMQHTVSNLSTKKTLLPIERAPLHKDYTVPFLNGRYTLSELCMFTVEEQILEWQGEE